METRGTRFRIPVKLRGLTLVHPSGKTLALTWQAVRELAEAMHHTIERGTPAMAHGIVFREVTKIRYELDARGADARFPVVALTFGQADQLRLDLANTMRSGVASIPHDLDRDGTCRTCSCRDGSLLMSCPGHRLDDSTRHELLHGRKVMDLEARRQVLREGR